jgi:hypothetical protein
MQMQRQQRHAYRLVGRCLDGSVKGNILQGAVGNVDLEESLSKAVEGARSESAVVDVRRMRFGSSLSTSGVVAPYPSYRLPFSVWRWKNYKPPPPASHTLASRRSIHAGIAVDFDICQKRSTKADSRAFLYDHPSTDLLVQGCEKKVSPPEHCILVSHVLLLRFRQHIMSYT